MIETMPKKTADLTKLKTANVELTRVAYGSPRLEVELEKPVEGLEALLKDCAAGDFRISGKLVFEKGQPEFNIEPDGDNIRIYGHGNSAAYIKSLISRAPSYSAL